MSQRTAQRTLAALAVRFGDVVVKLDAGHRRYTTRAWLERANDIRGRIRASEEWAPKWSRPDKPPKPDGRSAGTLRWEQERDTNFVWKTVAMDLGFHDNGKILDPEEPGAKDLREFKRAEWRVNRRIMGLEAADPTLPPPPPKPAEDAPHYMFSDAPKGLRGIYEDTMAEAVPCPWTETGEEKDDR